jgi:hypothetical protein
MIGPFGTDARAVEPLVVAIPVFELVLHAPRALKPER